MICSPQRITTLLQPLDERQHSALAHYAHAGLTAREQEVLALALRGNTNAEIGTHLGISRATLRTHLNRIYAKLRLRGISTEFLPGCRTRDLGVMRSAGDGPDDATPTAVVRA